MTQLIFARDDYEFDLFLSHASEDKDDVARPLAVLLQDLGLRVWFDEFELRIGDNIVDKLNKGINTSRFGTVVLSTAFVDLTKHWTKFELDTLEYLWVTENRVMFPVWHNISVHEIRSFRASLANIYGLSTARYTLEEIAQEICLAVANYDTGE